MKRIIALGLVLALGACGTLTNTNNATAQASLKAVRAVLTTYADVYQPAVIAYGNLPNCNGVLVVCRIPAIFQGLQTADAAVTGSIAAAQPVLDGQSADSGQIDAAISAITNAETLIGASGALKK